MVRETNDTGVVRSKGPTAIGNRTQTWEVRLVTVAPGSEEGEKPPSVTTVCLSGRLRVQVCVGGCPGPVTSSVHLRGGERGERHSLPPVLVRRACPFAHKCDVCLRLVSNTAPKSKSLHVCGSTVRTTNGGRGPQERRWASRLVTTRHKRGSRVGHGTRHRRLTGPMSRRRPRTSGRRPTKEDGP